jgi:nitronate monooxygenase
MAANILKSSTRVLRSQYPWIQTPLIVQAPMRILAGSRLAVTVSDAGGIGFIGPGEKPEHLQDRLQEASDLLATTDEVLPLGFGIQTWAGNLNTTSGNNFLTYYKSS